MGELTPHLYFKKSNLIASIASIFLFGIILLGTAESFSYSRVSGNSEAYTIAPGHSLDIIFDDMNLYYWQKILLKIHIKSNKINLIQAGHYDLTDKSWKQFIHSFETGEIKKFEFQIKTGSNIYELSSLIHDSSLKQDCPDFACLNNRFGYIEGTLMCLSFGIKKNLKMGKGGMILTDNAEAVEALKKLRWSGRHEATPMGEDDIETMGYNSYITPEWAARGLMLLSVYPENHDDQSEPGGYPDLARYGFIK